MMNSPPPPAYVYVYRLPTRVLGWGWMLYLARWFCLKNGGGVVDDLVVDDAIMAVGCLGGGGIQGC